MRYFDKNVPLVCGDCIYVMKESPENYFDGVVTDPPYGLEFMGQEWDKLGAVVLADPSSVGGFQNGAGGNPFSRSRIRFGTTARNMQEWHQQWAAEALRVLKPGGHLLVFGGTRTHHRLMCALEDAGFEIRDTLMWLYGSGFPKSLDISKAVDAQILRGGSNTKRLKQVNDVDRVGDGRTRASMRNNGILGETKGGRTIRDDPATLESAEWEGYGTALKPAWEPIILARKPISESNIALNCLKWGTGGLAIDDCRIEYRGDDDKASATPQGKCTSKETAAIGATPDAGRNLDRVAFNRPVLKGRWPANVLLDEEAAAMLDEQTENLNGGTAVGRNASKGSVYGGGRGLISQPKGDETLGYGDSGGASRFFYCAKASKKERGEGNNHPTVKPLKLLEYLCSLVKTPKGGVILDPFAGSGSILIAARNVGMDVLGIELNEEYCNIAVKRYKALFKI